MAQGFHRVAIVEVSSSQHHVEDEVLGIELDRRAQSTDRLGLAIQFTEGKPKVHVKVGVLGIRRDGLLKQVLSSPKVASRQRPLRFEEESLGRVQKEMPLHHIPPPGIKMPYASCCWMICQHGGQVVGGILA